MIYPTLKFLGGDGEITVKKNMIYCIFILCMFYNSIKVHGRRIFVYAIIRRRQSILYVFLVHTK